MMQRATHNYQLQSKLQLKLSLVASKLQKFGK